MEPVANQSLQNAGLMSAIILRGPSSSRPPGPSVLKSEVGIGSITMVRGQGGLPRTAGKDYQHMHIFTYTNALLYTDPCPCILGSTRLENLLDFQH